MRRAFVVFLAVFSLVLIAIGPAQTHVVSAEPNVCPNDNGWTKIDSDDLSLYPVEGATEYCFKAGPYVINYIPDGGFGQEGPCKEDAVQNCGLSHWSYFLNEEPEDPEEPEEPEDPEEPEELGETTVITEVETGSINSIFYLIPIIGGGGGGIAFFLRKKKN
jgi:hypothetical protein